MQPNGSPSYQNCKEGVNVIKIGFVDSWLDEWHAKLYPDFLREAASKYGFDVEISYVWAEKELPGCEITTQQYCELHGIQRADSLEQLIDAVDAIFVLSPDDSRTHEQLSRLPLMSGKPVYVDKTFGQDVKTARRMFDLAHQHHTPVFSCSAQRYCDSILRFMEENKGYEPMYCGTVGPGSLSNYSVHQLEMMNVLMGNGFKRVKAFGAGEVVHAIIDYGNGKFATFSQSPTSEFNLVLSDGTKGHTLPCKEYYIPFMRRVLQFFTDGIAPVSEESTMEILSIIDTIRAALQEPDTWVEAIGC